LKANQTGDSEPKGGKIFPNGYAFTSRVGHVDASSPDWANIHNKIAVEDVNPYDIDEGKRLNDYANAVNYPEMQLEHFGLEPSKLLEPSKWLAKSNGRWSNGNGKGSEKWDFVEENARFSGDQEETFGKLANGKIIDLKSENKGDSAPKSHPMGFTA
jgi:hypothetical protein